MPLDPKSDETRKWMEIARRDLVAGRKLVGDVTLSSQASFFSQQSAEKALKGFLVWHQTRFNKEHDLRYLGNLVVQKDPTLQSIVDEAAALNPFAVTFRYPGESDGPTVDDAVDALSIAQRLYDEILLRLPKAVRPQ